MSKPEKHCVKISNQVFPNLRQRTRIIFQINQSANTETIHYPP